MAMPVSQEEVERVLRPWLGSLFVNSTPLAGIITSHLSNYAPYRQTLESLRDELEVLLLTRLNSFTRGSLTVILDNYRSSRMGKSEIDDITDDLMGLIFGKLTCFLTESAFLCPLCFEKCRNVYCFSRICLKVRKSG